MRFLGLDITRTRRVPANLSPVSSRTGAWMSIVREPYTGAWQNNDEITAPTALSYFAVYACVTLIATDIGKLHLRLVTQDDHGIWTETTNPAYSPVLRKPNRYQTIVKFVEQWITSKLTAGNAYVLKQRDDRGVVSALYVLDPARVTPLVAPDGAVYYQLRRDDLTAVSDRIEPGRDVVVPAREMIHDPMVTLFHPLIGVTPLYACGLAAMQGLTIQRQSEQFFSSGSHPGGLLIAPGAIPQDTAQKLKDYWNTNFTGSNAGKIAVLSENLKYEPLSINAVDAQLIDQLKFSAQTVCSCYHVPPALLDLGESANVTDLEALLQKYHSQCIQSLLANFETSLDEGLELKSPLGTEFDIDDLIWMVTATKTKAAADSIGAGALSPNEARRKYFGVGPVTGGDTPYLQQQNFSLAALAERDANDPFSKAAPPAPATPATPAGDDDDVNDEKAFVAFRDTLTKALEDLNAA
jgi:HK97 family phage portal protein